MYELKRVYTNISERYVEGKGWVSSNKITKNDKVTMYAIEYIDIDNNGVVHGTGVEDFSIERFKKLGFAHIELKNKTEKEYPTLKTSYVHTLIKAMYARYNDKTAIKWYRKYIENRYINELTFNEITVNYSKR